MMLMERRRAMMGAKEAGGRLPNEYQAVEWIAADGSNNPAYLNLGKKVQNVYPISITCRFRKEGGGMYGSKLVSIGTPSNVFVCVDCRNPLRFTPNYNSTGFDTGLTVQNNVIYELSMICTADSYVASLDDGTQIQQDSGTFDALAELDDKDLTIFFRANNNNMRGRLYELEIKENGATVVNLVPCYRRSDSAVGAYDLVSREFFTTASASAVQFTKGNDV